MENKCLCIDVGGTYIKYAVIDHDRNISERGTVPTPHQDIKQYLDTLEAIFVRYRPMVGGIAVSAPGVIDSQNGVCITGGMLKYVKEFPLVKELENRCHVPVTVMNDAKCAALAESAWGALTGCRDAIVIVLGTGVGGAIIQNGQVQMGSHFSAGEFGRVMLGQNFELMDGYWAYHNGNARLVRLVSALSGRDPEQITSYDILKWAEQGDEASLWGLDLFTKDIAFMIMNLQSICDPEKFAIGGGISRQPLLLAYIQKNVRFYHAACPLPVPEPKVTACKFFNDSNLLGALGYYLSRYSTRPSNK